MLDSSSVFRCREDVRYRIVGGEAVVVRQQDAEVLVLSPVGARILELVSSSLSLAEVVERLEQEYDVERADLRRDVREFLQELVQAGVVEEVGDPPVRSES